MIHDVAQIPRSLDAQGSEPSNCMGHDPEEGVVGRHVDIPVQNQVDGGGL